MHAGKKFSGAAQARLDFIGHKKHAMLAADFRGFAKEAVARNDDAGFALNRLQQKRAGIWGDCGAKGSRVAKRNSAETGSEWAEALFVLRFGGKADHADGAPVKIIFADDDFGLPAGNSLLRVAPLARGLDRGFHGLGAGVHGQRHLVARQVVQFLIEQRELRIAKRARGERDLAGLFDQSGEQFRVAVALVDSGIGGQAIQIALPFHVVDPDTFAALDHHVERVIVVRAVSIFQRDEVLCSQQLHFRSGHTCIQ